MNTDIDHLENVNTLSSLILPPIIVLIEMIPNTKSSLNSGDSYSDKYNNSIDQLFTILEDAFTQVQFIRLYGFNNFYEFLVHFIQYTFNENPFVNHTTTANSSDSSNNNNITLSITKFEERSRSSSSLTSDESIHETLNTYTDNRYFDMSQHTNQNESTFKFNPQSVRLLVFSTRLFIRLSLHNLSLFNCCQHIKSLLSPMEIVNVSMKCENYIWSNCLSLITANYFSIFKSYLHGPHPIEDKYLQVHIYHLIEEILKLMSNLSKCPNLLRCFMIPQSIRSIEFRTDYSQSLGVLNVKSVKHFIQLILKDLRQIQNIEGSNSLNKDNKYKYHRITDHDDDLTEQDTKPIMLHTINSIYPYVSLVINGWFESIGDLILINKEFSNPHINCQQQFTPPVIRFGHVTDVYSSLECRRNTFDVGNVLLFTGLPNVRKISSSSTDYFLKCKKKPSKHHYKHLSQQSKYQNENYLNNSIKEVALSLSLLGPLFNGYFDSIESTAYYRNSANCILHAFIRRYASKDSILKSNHRHHHDYIMCTTECNESLTTEVNNDTVDDIHLVNADVNQHFKSFDKNTIRIVYAHSSKKRLWLLRSIYSSDKHQSLSHCVNYCYRESFDSVFEPHGGIEVAVCLLGELICQSHSSDLISYGLKLLFTMLRHSNIMYAKFYSPALSHPGVENSMERRHKNTWLFQNCNDQLNCKPVPLSFGHCLLARLFKHPEFNTISFKSYAIMKVLLNEIILTLPIKNLWNKSMKDPSSTVHLLINPSLLRCLLLFGSQSFWYPSSKQEQSGFGPLNSTHLSKSSKKSILLNYDKWQLIMATLTGFRELFLENDYHRHHHHSIQTTLLNNEHLKCITEQWPITSLMNFLIHRLSLSVVINETFNQTSFEKESSKVLIDSSASCDETRIQSQHLSNIEDNQIRVASIQSNNCQSLSSLSSSTSKHHHHQQQQQSLSNEEDQLNMTESIKYPMVISDSGALSGYCIWLHFEANKWIKKCQQLSSSNFSQSVYFDWSIPGTLHHNHHHSTSQSHRIIPFQLSRIRRFATGLLSPTTSFMCITNPSSEVDLKNYNNRHLCSKKLLDRALGLILHGLEKFSIMKNCETIFTEHFDKLQSNQDDHHKGNHLTSSSSSSAAVVDNDNNDETTTSEIDLCTYGLDALIILLQDSDNCVLSSAIKSNLLPVLFNMAWLLEFGMDKANSLLLMNDSDYNSTNRTMYNIPSLLMPILISLSRLIGRVTSWLIMDEKFSVELVTSTSSAFHYSLDTSTRFKLIRTFLQYLVSMKPELDNEDYDGYVVNLESELQFNPGPVSRCLVRRVLHSLLETSTSQLDRIGQELNRSVAISQQNTDKQQENDIQTNTDDGNIKYLCEHLKLHHNHLVWILNCTVNVLIYSPYRDENIINVLNQLSSIHEISKHQTTTISPVPSRIQSLHIDLGKEIDVDENIHQTCHTPSTPHHHHHDFADRKQTSCDLSKSSFHHDNDRDPECFIFTYATKFRTSYNHFNVYYSTTYSAILAQLIQIFWPKSTNNKLTSNENLFSSLNVSSKKYLPRKFSIAQLCSQARKQCVEGHNAWLDAYSERKRIVGPLGTVLWARVAEHLSHNGGLFYHSESTPFGWCVDPVEVSARQSHPLASLIGLPSIMNHSPPVIGSACTWHDLPLCLPLSSIPLIQLASASRYHIQAVWACRLVGILHIPPIEGDLILGQSWLRFQPDPLLNRNLLMNDDCNDNDSKKVQFIETESLYPYQSLSNRLWFAWSFKSIHHIEARRYSLRDIAVEIFPDETDVNAPMLFAMYSSKDRDNFIETITPLIGHRSCYCIHRFHNPLLVNMNEQSERSSPLPSNLQHHHHSTFTQLKKCKLQSVQQAWLNGELSNFDYLMKLNTAAGRSYNDLMQYPIFPWIIRDYESLVLDLTQPTTFRRLDRPIAVQEDDRAEAVAARFNEAELLSKTMCTSHPEGLGKKSKTFTLSNLSSACPPYHYPAHCSNEAIVLHFLVRLPPYTFRHLRFQGELFKDNNFDVPDRLFHSIATTWRLATTSVSCVKELVPEFYFQPEMFINRSGLKLGYRQPGDSVDNVELPPWCKNDPRLFILICRAALESDYVSMNLSHWIDLSFGYKQSGQNAKDSLNLYHPYTYFGAIDVDTIDDPVLAQAVEAMINNYGQTPKQLFHKHPHPCRNLSISNEAKLNMTSKFKSKSIDTMSNITIQEDVGDRRSSTPVLFNSNNINDDDKNSLQNATFSVTEKQYSSVKLDNTPLETVIGLKWGEWAGSPQMNSFEIIWKKQLINTKSSVLITTKNSPEHSEMLKIPFLNHLTGSIWCELNTKDTHLLRHMNQLNSISSINNDKLYHSWNGWVDFNIDHEIGKCFLSSSPSHSTEISSSPLSSFTTTVQTDFSWYWKILHCESNACIWVSLLPDISNLQDPSYPVPYLIKLKPSLLDSRTLNIFMKRLPEESHSTCNASSNPPYDKPFRTFDSSPSVLHRHDHQHHDEIHLQLPSSNPVPLDIGKSLITSLTISPSSSHGIQLFVGTCFGSIYVRQLPTNLYDISYIDNWLSQVKTAGLWEITGWKQLYGHAGHEITSLVINRNNSLIASGDNHGYVCLWDRYRLTLIQTINTNIINDHHDQQNELAELGSNSSRSHSIMTTTTTTGHDYQNHNDLKQPYRQFSSNHLNVENSMNKICWLGVYSCSGVWIANRILDFLAEINDPLIDSPLLQIYNDNDCYPSVPMAFSTVSEGRGVNCLLVGGPGGRLVWLNSWTLDTVRTYMLPDNDVNARITSVCFGPLLNHVNYHRNSKDLGEILCQGLYISVETGCLYHFGPKSVQTCTNIDPLNNETYSSYSYNDLYKHSIVHWLDT
ncbi:beige/beach protein-related [Schistosoma mansoni]|uniref:beige/beach protein-related n=1 Tax=Schistosoma mansoni TaxID=6183 RepID=UPI00022DCC79|nr:beige/beach protein-related [Schistosoma mansoni]|eukprot:XP_018655598.1 beige/beach protein-related [Schistosoma mansoni]